MVYILSIMASILFLCYLLYIVKKGKLDERHSIFWIIFSLVIILLSLIPDLTEYIAKKLNIYYAPSVLFLFGILFIIGYLIHLSIVCTKQNKMIIRLTQELAIEQKNNGGKRKWNQKLLKLQYYYHVTMKV